MIKNKFVLTAINVYLIGSLSNCAVNPDLAFLQQKPDAVSIVGKLCSQKPNAITSPVNITLLVDDSGSMARNDPDGLRADAVQEIINEFITDEKPNYKIMIIKYASGAENLTNGFTRDLTELNAAVGNLVEAEGWTNMPQALNSARGEIEEEIIDLQQEFGTAADAYFPSIILADGRPIVDMVTKEAETLIALEMFMAIKDNYSIGDINMNAAFLGDASDAGYGFMQQVASRGNGAFLHFQQASDITFLNQGINLEPLIIPYALVDIFAVNMNTVIENTGVNNPSFLPDTDADGLSDLFENSELNTNPFLADSDEDLITDLVEFQRITDPNVAQTHCSGTDATDDKDQDGLIKCMERTVFSEDALFDSDEDGMIDLLEVLFGTDPSIADAAFDMDGDGLSNLDEIKAGRNPNIDDEVLHDTYAIKNSINFTGINSDGLYCYQVDITNIKLAQTLSKTTADDKSNEIRVYMIQKPLDGSLPKDYVLAEGIININLSDYYTTDMSSEIALSQIDFEYIVNPQN